MTGKGDWGNTGDTGCGLSVEDWGLDGEEEIGEGVGGDTGGGITDSSGLMSLIRSPKEIDG